MGCEVEDLGHPQTLPHFPLQALCPWDLKAHPLLRNHVVCPLLSLLDVPLCHMPLGCWHVQGYTAEKWFPRGQGDWGWQCRLACTFYLCGLRAGGTPLGTAP